MATPVAIIPRKAIVKRVPVTSVTALSEIIISLVERLLKRNLFSTGIMAAGSVDASMAPSSTATIVGMDKPNSLFKIPMVVEKRKAVSSNPGKERENILRNN